MDAQRAEQANSFGRAADEYERSRPTYPSEAAGWLVPAAAKTVLDLGAGTGKFTRSLVARGLDVIAVDPDAAMLATLHSALPGVRTLTGTAEQIPLPDHSVDAVTLAQAWHWVDPQLALPELARVLKPGGTLGLVWNIRDERADWVRQLSEIIDHSDAEQFIRGEIVIGAPFGPIERFEVDWVRDMDVESLVTLVESRSYIITAGADVRRAILEGVRGLVARHPDLRGKPTFELPYRTICFRAALA
ncbi:MAG: methyltransferase domain-containing protein [Rhodoglobus sp.]